MGNNSRKDTQMTKKKFAERYFPYNREGAFWQGWLFSGSHCPYDKGTPQATAWHLGAEAKVDYEVENVHD